MSNDASPSDIPSTIRRLPPPPATDHRLANAELAGAGAAGSSAAGGGGEAHWPGAWAWAVAAVSSDTNARANERVVMAAIISRVVPRQPREMSRIDRKSV